VYWKKYPNLTCRKKYPGKKYPGLIREEIYPYITYGKNVPGLHC
jgi:hypothetical protein